MVDCDYCSESFDGEEAYLRHLRDAHGEELGPIDRRRVDSFFGRDGDDEETDIGAYVLSGIGLIGIAVVTFVLVSAATGGGVPFLGDSGGGPGEPHSLGTVHEHGTMVIVVEGERLDTSKERFQLQADCFHFERGEARVWHTHCQDVTLGWALGTLGIDASQTTLTYDGTTYRESEGWNVSVTVDGERVGVDSYVLQGAGPVTDAGEGDHVRVVVKRAE